MDMESEYARFMSELDATVPAESPTQPAAPPTQPVQPSSIAPPHSATPPPAAVTQRPAGTPPPLAQAQQQPTQNVQAARPPGQPPAIAQQQHSQAPSGLPGPPPGAPPPLHAARPAGPPPALHAGMPGPPGYPGHPPFAQPQHYGGYGQPQYGAQAPAPPQSTAAAGFDPLNIDAEALRKEILGEKKPGTKKAKKPKEGQLRFAGGEAWVDDKMDYWPEGDFRIFVGNLGPEVNDEVLEKAFAAYPSFTKGRVIKDYKKCKTKSFGFVSFTDHTDGAKALRAMHGKYIGNRPCQLKKSTHTVRNAPEEAGKRKAMQNNPLERVTTKRMR